MVNMVNYSLRSFFGWSIIFLLSITPLFLWVFLGESPIIMTNYANSTHSLGEIFGLIGMTMFALTFILSTRISWIEDLFGGLDKVYIAHGILGGGALILILLHPIFLVLKFIPSQISLAAKYLSFSSYWSVNLGIIALGGLIVLIYLTLYTKIRYHYWKFSHEFLGLVFLLAVLHVFLVRGTVSQDNIFDGYFVYASIVSLIGLFGFCYSLFLKNRIWKTAVYTLSRIDEQKGVFSLTLIPQHKPLNYKSGQFVYLRFYNERLPKEPHPFSIASKSNNHELKIIIKKLGDFTNRLDELRIGDKVSLEGPYGRFIFRNYPSKDHVWIAAGIGVTPFLYGFEDLEEIQFSHKVDFYHLVREESDFIDYDRLSKYPNKKVRFIPWISDKNGFLTVNSIKKYSGSLMDKEFFICGPDSFKEAIIKDLLKEGVSRHAIHVEAFGFR